MSISDPKPILHMELSIFGEVESAGFHFLSFPHTMYLVFSKLNCRRSSQNPKFDHFLSYCMYIYWVDRRNIFYPTLHFGSIDNLMDNDGAL